MRLIDADALKKTLCEEYEAREHYSGEIMLKAIDNAPTVEAYSFEQVQELVKLNQQFAQKIEDLKRPQGKWERRTMNEYLCSNCHYKVDSVKRLVYKFCPKCGTAMEGGEKNESTRS